MTLHKISDITQGFRLLWEDFPQLTEAVCEMHHEVPGQVQTFIISNNQWFHEFAAVVKKDFFFSWKKRGSVMLFASSRQLFWNTGVHYQTKHNSSGSFASHPLSRDPYSLLRGRDTIASKWKKQTALAGHYPSFKASAKLVTQEDASSVSQVFPA